MPSPLRPPLLLAALLAFALPARAQRAVTAGTEERARQAVAESAVALGAAERADAGTLAVTDAHADPTTGLTFVYLAQTLGGVVVDAGRVVVGLGQDGAPFHVAGTLVPDIASARPQMPALSAAEAGVAAARAAAPGTAAADGADLVYVVDGGGSLRLAWRVLLPETVGADGPHRWRVDVDAATGAEIARADLVLREGDPGLHGPVGAARPDALADVAPLAEQSPFAPLALAASYRVYALPTESPTHAGDPATDLRTLVADPHDALASLYGWHDTNGAVGAEHTTTRGNNVDAAPHAGTGQTAPNGGPGLTFSFPFDPTLEPAANLNAAVTNAFYWLNVAHDVLYRYGFTEGAGNFQQNNYGRGGRAGDAVGVTVQEPAAINNGYMATPVDGLPPTLLLGRWTYTAPERDIAFDASVVVHEYAHGLSNRLVGGPSAFCLGDLEQPGEGWSDLVAMLLTMRPGDNRHTPRGIAAYGTGQPPGGTIRPAPYAADFAINAYTYGDTRTLLGPHRVGFVWATAVWEATWDLIDAYGFSPDVYDAAGTAGNQIALRLLVTGLKLTPCAPGFVDARDAMLAADQALYGGAHLGLLWGAFARRGLGASASQGSSNVLTDNEEAFDLPLPAGSATVGPSTVTASASAAAASTVPTATVTVANTGGSGDLHFQARIAYTTAVGGDAPPAEPGRPAEDGEYTWTSSDAPGGPPFAFHDISATGSPITFFQGGYTEAPLPFPFPFYGRTYDRAFLTSKGFLTFLPPTGLPTPTGIPNPTPPNALIAPFWTSGSITEVYTGVLPDGRFAVQFESSARRFEVLLSPGGVIEFQYDVIGPAIPTYSGIEDEGGVRGLATVRPDHDRTAIRIRPPEGWLTVDPAEGTVPPGGSVPLTLSFDPTDLTAGTHAARLLVSTNEADRPTHAVDVRLTVAPAAEFTGRAGWRLLAAPVTGMTVGDLAAQNLVQGTPGLYPGAAPNLLTAYDGTAWRAPTGPGAALPPGRGFAWYLFDDDRDPGGPSRSVPLPARLATPADAATPAGPVAIPLHAAGDGLNVVGNPFDAALDASGLTSWAAGGSLASGVGQVWDPSMSSFRLTTEPGVMVAPWQGFVVENGSATALTVPAPAPTTPPAPANTRRLVFVVEGSTPEGIAVADRATILQFGPGGAQGWDAGDATELRPLASTYVSLSFEGARDGRAVLKAQESRPEALAPLSIPLGFAAAGTTGVFTLRLMVPASEALPAGWRLELEDLVTGSRTDLRYTSFYQFSGTAQPAGPEPDLAHGLALAAAPRRFMLNLLAPAVPPVAAPLPLDDHRLTLTLEGATPDGTPVLDLPLVLGLHPEASAEWDAWDGLRPLPTAPYAALAFRGLHGGQMVLKVQESQPFPADTTVAAPSFEVPLAFEAANTDSVFVLRWSTPAGFPANWALALEDVETGARTDLRQTDHYAFTAPSREAPDVPLLHAYVRFVLRVTPQAPPTPPPTTVFALHAPAPNPAGTATTIRYETAAEGPVRVEVLDVLGRCIAVLADGREEAGLYTAVLDAGRLASGAYVVRMRAGTFVQTRRLTVAR